jgi:hypothetical protein
MEEFGAMLFETVQRNLTGWVKEVKSNGEAIIEGAKAYRGKLLAKKQALGTTHNNNETAKCDSSQFGDVQRKIGENTRSEKCNEFRMSQAQKRIRFNSVNLK